MKRRIKSKRKGNKRKSKRMGKMKVMKKISKKRNRLRTVVNNWLKLIRTKLLPLIQY